MGRDVKRFPWLLTVVCTAAFAVLIALGVWQVKRLAWKEGLIAQAEANGALPPAPLETFGAGSPPEFRKVTVRCPGLATAPYLELQTIQDGQAGVRLVSACKPQGSARTWWVDRGFVADTISSRPAEAFSTAPVEVTAEARTTPEPNGMAPAAEGRHFYTRDSAAMARTLRIDGPVAPMTLFALTSSNPEWRALQPSAPPAAFSNNHLGYALTWFGLAVALAGFYVALLFKSRKPKS